MNRTALWIPLVFLAGLILGALHPRAELRRTRNELEARKKAERTPPPPVERLDRLLQMLPLDTPRPSAAEERASSTPASDPSAPSAESPPMNAPPVSHASPDETPEERRARFEEQLEQAAEAWRLRGEVARQTFAAQAGLNATEQAAFEAAIQSMNERLEALFSALAERLRQGEPMTPETGLAVMHEASGILLETYQELDQTLPPTWRQETGQNFDIVQQVDPGVLRPLLDVRESLQPPTGGSLPPPGGRGPLPRLFGPPPAP